MMAVQVKYVDYNTVIDEVKIKIGEDKHKVIKPVKVNVCDPVSGDFDYEYRVKVDVVDNTISHTVSQVMNQEEIREYIQVLQKVLMQINKSNKKDVDCK
ncbi:hypothetical protein ACFVRU_23335 [Streptomyces sp. NPDC057927]